jgi:hypothetical protein
MQVTSFSKPDSTYGVGNGFGNATEQQIYVIISAPSMQQYFSALKSNYIQLVLNSVRTHSSMVNIIYVINDVADRIWREWRELY